MSLEIAIITLEIVSLVLVFLLFSQNSKNVDLVNFKQNLKEYIELMDNHIKEKISDLTKIIQEKIDRLSQTVDQRLQQWFEKTNTTFSKIIERMAKIQEAQKNIEKLSTNIVSLQQTLTDSKQKWIFWEVQLEHIVSSLFWKNNQKYYVMEYFFEKENVRVDCVIKTNQWLLCIDSKFPLKHWYELYDKNNSTDLSQKKKSFVNAVKKQVDEIDKKYHILDKTLDTVLMFVPSEAIFSTIHTEFYDLVDYAHKKNVAIVSPTTLTAMLTIILSTIQSQKTQEQAKIIQIELSKLWQEFKRFYERWWKFTKDLKTVHKDIENIDITSGKIIWKFDKIKSLDFDSQSSS